MPARPGAAIDFGCEGLDVGGLHSSFVSRLLLGEESIAEIIRGPFLNGEVVVVPICRDGMKDNKEGQNTSKYCKIHEDIRCLVSFCSLSGVSGRNASAPLLAPRNSKEPVT